MAKAFSIASWNVEHFKGDPSRAKKVVEYLMEQKPDVFALYEVEGSKIFNVLVNEMSGYTFHLTEGVQVQEILVGVKAKHTAFFSQRLEFKSGSTHLRPGAMLTLKIDGLYYPMLFLHTKSGDDPKGLGLRDDMLERAVDFKKALDKNAADGEQSNYIFLGDLNTMGMKFKYLRELSIEAKDELLKLDRKAKRRKMRRLSKTADQTWSNGSGSSIPDSDLDHVVAADHLKFKQFSGADVDVRGWVEESTVAKKDKWIEEYSDHSLLYLEVQKP